MICKNRFGVGGWLVMLKRELMGEPADHFQEFFPAEKIEILSMFEELTLRDSKDKECFKYLVRRVNGQVNPGISNCTCYCLDQWSYGVDGERI